MPIRRLTRKVRNPEAVAVAAIALRGYLDPQIAKSDFQDAMNKKFDELKLDKDAAARMLATFDRTKPSVRERMFGPLAVQKTIPVGYKVNLRPPVLAGSSTQLMRSPIRAAANQAAEPAAAAAGLARPPDQTHPDPGEGGQRAPKFATYTITYEGMHCIDETHADWAGSDETYVVTSALHITKQGDNVVRSERHPLRNGQSGIYGDVDSHETFVGPRAAVWSAREDKFIAGTSITTTFFEHDFGDPDYYKQEVEDAVIVAIAIVAHFFPGVGTILALIESKHLISDFINALLSTGDDEIGTTTVIVETDELEELSRTHTVEYFERRGDPGTGLDYQFLVEVNDNDYVAAFQVRRDPPLPPFEIIVE
ncbi:hypothetical protein [Leifsonia sp. fls2-241-R2A-40a]|uniref:hypothetical protein n=1 Tax=Leifsonia sp. fls2-241-R2A-40a TaxID=3040290 RepID=UPI00254B35C2|nr:hypothetical protein [Leifsonia sp. fls2-241-R2A-40a]